MQFFVKFVRSALKVTLGLAKGSVIINYLWRGEGGGGRGGGVPPELAGSGIEGRCSHNLQSDQNAYKSAVVSSS